MNLIENISVSWINDNSNNDDGIRKIISLVNSNNSHTDECPFKVILRKPEDSKETCTLKIKFNQKIFIKSIVTQSTSKLVEFYHSELDDYLGTSKSMNIGTSDDGYDVLESSMTIIKTKCITQDLTIKFCSQLEKDVNILKRVMIRYENLSEDDKEKQDKLAQDQTMESMMAIMSLLSKSPITPIPQNNHILKNPPLVQQHQQQHQQQQHQQPQKSDKEPIKEITNGKDQTLAIKSMLEDMESRMNDKFNLILNRIDKLEERLNKNENQQQ